MTPEETKKPEVGKWYEVPLFNYKFKCFAYDNELMTYYFATKHGIISYPENNDFSNFKEVQP